MPTKRSSHCSDVFLRIRQRIPQEKSLCATVIVTIFATCLNFGDDFCRSNRSRSTASESSSAYPRRVCAPPAGASVAIACHSITNAGPM